MLNIKQFRYGMDNLAYMIFGQKQAMVIDGGSFNEILSFLKSMNLTLIYVTNTHSHSDHTSGNDQLLKATDADFLKPSILVDNQQIIIDGQKIIVYQTPGHSDDSICFHTGHSLISGDTLFNGTIGNCFSGNLHNFYLSIKRLLTLSDETIIYAGHDYVNDSLAFARHLDPHNKDIDFFNDTYNFRTAVYSTMAEERKINPYLRFNEPPVIEMLKKHNLPFATEWDRWNSLMSIE